MSTANRTLSAVSVTAIITAIGLVVGGCVADAGDTPDRRAVSKTTSGLSGAQDVGSSADAVPLGQERMPVVVAEEQEDEAEANANGPYEEAPPDVAPSGVPYGEPVPPYGEAVPPYGEAVPPYGEAVPPYGEAVPPEIATPGLPLDYGAGNYYAERRGYYSRRSASYGTGY